MCAAIEAQLRTSPGNVIEGTPVGHGAETLRLSMQSDKSPLPRWAIRKFVISETIKSAQRHVRSSLSATPRTLCVPERIDDFICCALGPEQEQTIGSCISEPFRLISRSPPGPYTSRSALSVTGPLHVTPSHGAVTCHGAAYLVHWRATPPCRVCRIPARKQVAHRNI